MASILSTIGKASSLVTSLKGLVTSNKQTTISNLAIDCVHNEEIEYTNVITDHPISSKSSVSDHIYHEPNVVTIDGTITDSSMRIYGIIETPLQKNSIASLIKNARSLLPFGTTEKPSQAAFNILEKIRDNKELVTVVCKRRVFKNMAIEKLRIKEDETTVHRLSFTCTLKQVVFASVKSTAYKSAISKVVNSIQKPSAANLSSTSNKGLVAPVKSEEKSIGAKISDYFSSPSSEPAPVDNDPNLRGFQQALDMQ